MERTREFYENIINEYTQNLQGFYGRLLHDTYTRMTEEEKDRLCQDLKDNNVNGMMDFIMYIGGGGKNMSCPRCHEDNTGVIEGTITRTVTKGNGKRYFEEVTKYRCPCGCEFKHIERYELRFVCAIDKE